MTYVTCPIRALPPGGRSAEGRDVADPLRRALPARPGRGGEPQRARRRRSAGPRSAGPPRDAGRGGRDHLRPLRRRHDELPRRPLRRRVGAAVGPARPAGADRPRRLRPGVLRHRRPAGRPDDRHRAQGGARGDVRRRPAAEGKARVGQIAVSYDTDRDAAVAARARAVPLVRPRLEGQRRPARTLLVRGGDAVRATPRRSAEQLPCGPDVEEHVEKIRPFVDAGFTEMALVQIGGAHQEEFIDWAERELLPALRSL